MVEAKNEATYIVEPTNSNIDASNGFTVRKQFKDTVTTTTYTTNVTAMFDDILDQMTRPTASGSTMKGGTLFLKNGTYTIETSEIIAGDSTDGPNVNLRIVGESRERTILKCGFTGDSKMLQCNCSVDVENLTFDGNTNGFINGIYTSETIAPTKTLKVTNCKFTNIEGFDIFMGENVYGLEISHCLFENQQHTQDQVAFESTGYSHIHDNVFDRTTGETNGEQLTSGSAKNCVISNNIFKITGSNRSSISLEGFNAHQNYDGVIITGNMIHGGLIRIGSSGAWSETFRNMTVSNNLLYNGTITLQGPSSGSYTDLLKDITVENNTIIDAWEGGVMATRIDGFITIRNNTIKNSNKSLNATTFDKGGIYLNALRDLICENNSIYMDVSTSNQCPYGIRYDSCINPTIRNNRIINRTANSAYVDAGSNSGTILISRTL